jgi:hypothetical protein
MKRNRHFKQIMTAFIYCLLLVLTTHAQNTSSESGFQLVVENQEITTSKTFEFDLVLYDLDPSTPLELALLQAGIFVNPAFYEGGKVTASIVPGSSALLEAQQPLGVMFAQDAGIIKLPSRTLKPLPKEAKPERRGTLIAKAPGTRICRILLTNTSSFTKASPELKFNFAKLPYPTTVSQYIDGVNSMQQCDNKNCIVKP